MEVTDWECPGRKDRDCLCSLWSSRAKRAALLAVIPAREGTEYFSFFFSKMLNFPTPQHHLPRAPLARELLILNHPLLRVKGKVAGLPKEKPSSNTTFEKGCLLCKETKPAMEKLFPEEQERPESFPPRFQESQPLLLIRHSLHPFLACLKKVLTQLLDGAKEEVTGMCHTRGFCWKTPLANGLFSQPRRLGEPGLALPRDSSKSKNEHCTQQAQGRGGFHHLPLQPPHSLHMEEK